MSGRLILRLAPILALVAYVLCMTSGPLVTAVRAQLAVGQGLGLAGPAAAGSGTTCATPAPTASPIPTPAVVGSPQALVTPGGSVTYAGIQAGDVAMIASTGSVANLVNIIPAAFGFSQGGLAFNGGSTYVNVELEPITAQQGTTIFLPILTGAATGVCIVVYRNIVPISDGLATFASGDNASPTGNTFTNTVNGEFVWWVVGVNPDAAATVTAPNGYNLDCTKVAVNPTNYGISVASTFIATAGASQGGAAGGLSGTDHWGVSQFGIQPLTNGAY